MDVKCIALDLDCTTLTSQKRLSPGNRAALEACIAKGIHIIIASGRSFSALPQDMLDVPGIEYAITSNGAAVYHIPTARRLHSYTLEPDSAEKILQLTQGAPLLFEAFADGKAYADAAYVADPVAYATQPRAIPYIQSTRTPIPDMPAFIRQHSRELDSLDLVLYDFSIRESLWKTLQAEIPEIYITSSVQQLIEISHRDAGKHSGVRFVAEQLGLEPGQIAAFGDGENDADMLSYVGCGIAMENAVPLCKAAADAITLHNDADGVAYGIHNILGL